MRFVALALCALVCTPNALLLAQGKIESSRSCIERVGDVDRDGRPDFAIARRHLRGFGTFVVPPALSRERVWVVSSATGAVIRVLEPSRPAKDFGRAMVDAGDVNGDGHSDLAVAGDGALWIYSGADGALLHELGGALAGPGFARSIAAGRDVDGDTVPDLAVYRAPSDDGALDEGGIVAVYSGANGILMRVFGTGSSSSWGEAVGPHRFALLPDECMLGAVALCADRDGDGRAELAFATRFTVTAESSATREVQGIAVVDALNGHRFVQFAFAAGREHRPWIMKAVPDLDADGFDELCVTSIHHYTSTYSGLDGRELRFSSWVGYKMNGEGTSFDVIRDVNADGIADLLLGANEDDWDCDDGFAALQCGRTGRYLRMLLLDVSDMEASGRSTECGPGADVCALGDFDRDGVEDALVAIPRLDQLRILSGKDFGELRRFAISPITEPVPPASGPSTDATEPK